MSSSFPDEGFTYPDPSFYGLTRPSGLHLPPHQAAPTAASSTPATAPVPTPSARPLALDPSLLALPGSAATSIPATIVAAASAIPAPIAGPVFASFACAPRLSVVGVIFPGFPAGLVPPTQINGEDAARYNSLVAEVYNNTNAGLRSGTPYGNSESLHERRVRIVHELEDMWAAAGGLPTPREQ